MKLSEIIRLTNDCYLSGKRLPLAVTRMRYSSANANVPAHSHEFAELTLIVKGAITHHYSCGKDRLRSGDFFIVHPGAVHAYSSATRDIELYNVLFDPKVPIPQVVSLRPSLIGELYPDTDGRDRPPYVLGRMRKRELASTSAILEVMRMRCSGRSEASPLMLAHLLAAAIAEFSAAHVSIDARPGEKALLAVCSFIDTRLDEPLPVERLAKTAGVSKRTLLRLFKDVFGTSPGAYVRSMRIARAKALLSSTNHKLSVVAENCGFHDASHLAKIFNHHVGFSPGKIRKDSRGGYKEI